jgi:hypothetical protein
MRSRFALFIAAAVVFAPGWQGQEAPQRSGASDLAARVLAPTGDPGAIREAVADTTGQFGGRQSKRWRLGVTFHAVSAFGLGASALAIAWLVTSYLGSLSALYRLRFRFSRAPPPLLQPA